MAFSLLVNTIARSDDGAAVTTASLDTTGANLIVIATGGFTAPTVTDSKSNTWTGLTAQVGSFDTRVRLYYAYAPTVGSGHTFTSTASLPAIAVLAFSGSASSPFDQENGTAGSTGNTVQTGSVTPTTDDQVLVTAFADFLSSDTLSIDSGFTISDQQVYVPGDGAGLRMAYKIQTSAGAENPEWSWTTTGSQYPAAIATFKSGVAVVGHPAQRRFGLMDKTHGESRIVEAGREGSYIMRAA